jgi:uncharacterized cupredoxin-like copper-binding protein
MQRLSLTSFVLAALAGCTTGDIVLESPSPGYVQDIQSRANGADWSKTETVTVKLSEFRFEPPSLVFQEGVPYRLVFLNIGERTHTFVSEGFFKAIGAQRLTFKDGEHVNPYFKSVEIASGAERELYFVPVREGAYPLECSVFLHDTFGMEGQITIR